MATKKKSPSQGERGEEWSKENSAEENDSRRTTTSVLRTQKRGWLAQNNEPRERPPSRGIDDMAWKRLSPFGEASGDEVAPT